MPCDDKIAWPSFNYILAIISCSSNNKQTEVSSLKLPNISGNTYCMKNWVLTMPLQSSQTSQEPVMHVASVKYLKTEFQNTRPTGIGWSSQGDQKFDISHLSTFWVLFNNSGEENKLLVGFV